MNHIMLSNPFSRWHCALAVLCALAALAPAPLYAQPSGAPPPSSRQALYRSAHDAMKEKNWELAHKLLSDLWASAKTHDVAISLGQVEYRLGNDAEAARYIAWAVALVPPQEKAETIEDYKGALAEIKQKVAAVRVKADPTITELRVDGKLAAESPEPREIYLSPGVHVVEGWVDDRPVSRQSIDVRAAQELEISLDASGETVRANGAPGAAPDQTPSPISAPPMEERAQGTSARTFVLAGELAVATIAAGIGTAYLIRASSASDDADTHLEVARSEFGSGGCGGPPGFGSPSCRRLADARDRHDQSVDIAAAAFVVSGAALLASAATFVLWPDDRKSSGRLLVTPAVGTRAAGLTLNGSFQ